MIYKKNYKVTQDYIENQVQKIYRELNVFKEADADEFLGAFNIEILPFINSRESLDDKTTRVLGKEFVRNNKNKGKFIIKNKKYDLIEFIDTTNIEEDEIKIKLVLKDNIYDKSCMFKDCESLIKFSINTDVNNNFERITELSEDKFIDIEFNDYYMDDNQINLDSFFCGCDFFDEDPSFNITETIEVSSKLSSTSSFTVKNITEGDEKINLRYMFFNCLSLISLPSEISTRNTKDIIDISGIFKNCILLKSLPDLFKWNTESVMDMNSIFHNCIIIVYH
jgi:surface protein